MLEALSPIEPHVETLDEEIDLAAGLRARPAPGHTPGSTVFVVSDAGERVRLVGQDGGRAREPGQRDRAQPDRHPDVCRAAAAPPMRCR